jgi:hypothetical protein
LISSILPLDHHFRREKALEVERSGTDFVEAKEYSGVRLWYGVTISVPLMLVDGVKSLE